MLEYNLTPKPASSEQRLVPRSLLSNLLLILISAGLVVWAFRLLHDKLTLVTSRDAVINGALIDINAPQEGTVTDLPATTGATTAKNQTVVTLSNDRVSELQVQEIKSRINSQQKQLQRAQNQLNRSLALRQIWMKNQGNQQFLETAGAQDAVRQAEADLKATQSRYRLATLSYERAVMLRQEGATPQASLDEAALQKEQLENEVRSLEARLQGIRTNQQAAQLGLSLDRGRTNYDPNMRLQDLETQITDQQLEIQTLQQGIADANAELVKAQADLQRRQRIVVAAPTSGVIWRLNAQRGQFVQQGASLGQVLDCRRRWVDVFVDEQAVRSLYPGMPAEIELYGNAARTLNGRVSIIRSGVGRLQPGQDVAVPIAPNLPRTTQVRVDLNPNTDTGSPDVMCYVGYTGKVSFKR